MHVRAASLTRADHTPQGVDWDVGAIGNAEWTGARLVDVLKVCACATVLLDLGCGCGRFYAFPARSSNTASVARFREANVILTVCLNVRHHRDLSPKVTSGPHLVKPSNLSLNLTFLLQDIILLPWLHSFEGHSNLVQTIARTLWAVCWVHGRCG